jgi:hypothetical protein
MSTEQSCLSARAESPFGGSLVLHRRASSPSRKTRARRFRRHSSGRNSRRGRFRPISTPGWRACGYKTAPGRSNWPNRDPIEESGRLNLYGFVGNNPLRWVDPYGLDYGDWWDPRTWFNSGFTDSWSDQATSIGQTWGDILTGNWGDIGNNYDDSTLGQAEAAGPGVHTATKVCIGTATAAAIAAAAVGAFEFAALGNQSIMVEGVLGGGRMGSGGLFQLRVPGRPPIIRFDFHPFRSGGRPLPHVDSPPLGWHHWPWQ